MTTAKHRAIDRLRQLQLHSAKAGDISRELDAQWAEAAQKVEAAMDDAIGDDWMRPQLCDEALRLGRIMAALTPVVELNRAVAVGVADGTAAALTCNAREHKLLLGRAADLPVPS